MKSVPQSSGKSVSGGTSKLKPLPIPLGGQVLGAVVSNSLQLEKACKQQ